ncbi:MAG: PKD domain-containing protein [Nitrospirota bacterium]
MTISGNAGRGKLRLAVTAFCLIVLFVRTAWTAGMPVYIRLQPVTNSVNAPTAVALDSYENIYVAESINKRIRIYSQSGSLKDTIQGLNSPVSVAVDGSGRVYAGDKTGGYVAVYDSGLSLLYKLGSGDGEFIQPNDIAIDSAGMVYVADLGMNMVKIYGPDGAYSGFIGGPGNGSVPTPDGKFNRPTSIEISEATGEIIVLDHGLAYDSYGTVVDGARIQKFGPDGSFRSSLNKYGTNILSGEMQRPQHIAVDGQGRIYVTDTSYNVVLVYGDDGDGSNGNADVYLGTVYDLDSPLRIPVGITIGRNSKLYVASLTANRIDVFGMGSYTDMTVSPLRITYPEGQCAVFTPESVTIVNNGTAALNWSADAQESWIYLSELSGTVPVSGTYSLNIGAEPAGLTAGHYSGTVRLSAGTGDTEIITVEMTASPVPLIADAGASYTGTEGQPVMLDASSSTGCIINYEWDADNDGTYEYSSAFPQQGLIFNQTGIYNVALRITDNTGTTEHATAEVSVSDAVPDADFTGYPNTGTAPLAVQFTNSSSGRDQPLAYEWDFDCDASVDSTEVSPSHTYETGTYSVCLTVRDSDGSAGLLTRSDYISITAATAGCDSLPVKMGTVFYPTLQDAYNDAADGAVILSRAADLIGDLIADRDISVSLVGGHDCSYSDIIGKTVLSGTLTMSSGMLSTGGVILQ